MRFLRAVVYFSVIAGLSGCIWSPSDHAQKESNTSITVSGYTLSSGDIVTLQATNLTTGVPATVGSATTSSTPSWSLGRDPVPASIDRMNGIRSECEVIVTAEDVAVVGRDEADSRHERERVGVVV